jgi:hypothetical protein
MVFLEPSFGVEAIAQLKSACEMRRSLSIPCVLSKCHSGLSGAS